MVRASEVNEVVNDRFNRPHWTRQHANLQDTLPDIEVFYHMQPSSAEELWASIEFFQHLLMRYVSLRS